MCRSNSDGGRRCTGGGKARNRVLGTARKAVERARHAAAQARTTGDTDAIAVADAKVTAAEQRLTDTHAANPHTPAAGQAPGHDTEENVHVTEEQQPAPDVVHLHHGENSSTGNHTFFNAGNGNVRIHTGDGNDFTGGNVTVHHDYAWSPGNGVEPEAPQTVQVTRNKFGGTQVNVFPGDQGQLGAHHATQFTAADGASVTATGDVTYRSSEGTRSVVFGFTNTDDPDNAPTTYGFVNGELSYGTREEW